MSIPQDDRMNDGDVDEAGPLSGNVPPDAYEETVKCPRCGYSFITKTSGKQKLRTRVLVFVGNGNVMGICPKCKANLKVPVSFRGGVSDVTPGVSQRRPARPNSGRDGAEGGVP